MSYFDAKVGTYLAVIALLIITPGPDMALVSTQCTVGGETCSFIYRPGHCHGSIFWGLMLVLGIATLLESSVVAFTVCKYVGGGLSGVSGSAQPDLQLSRREA